MNISTIQIHTTKAQIGMTTTAGRQSIQQPPASVDIWQPKADMTIQTKAGLMTIDQSQAWADMDRKHIFQRTREMAAEGMRKALEGTGRRAAEGRELADPYKGRNAIVAQAARHSTRNYETEPGLIPSHGSVKLNYEPAVLTIDVQVRPVENNTRANKPIIHYQPGDVNIQLKQYASIEFQVVNKTI
ncbi:hypothetical protein BTO30_01065 [Domibacillus antri]|uniref:YviE n=1 Tax=Domibacillus antri TaxID=1714264 RepID=A0A1Q8Q9M2_9BACI|nr:DUF6470 family protein [Domibacillus antri]OLN24039.1 hypothetical protein BTO30_01065 [Domibacillus antri]